jgi:hypothetical protein
LASPIQGGGLLVLLASGLGEAGLGGRDHAGHHPGQFVIAAGTERGVRGGQLTAQALDAGRRERGGWPAGEQGLQTLSQ